MIVRQHIRCFAPRRHLTGQQIHRLKQMRMPTRMLRRAAQALCMLFLLLSPLPCRDARASERPASSLAIIWLPYFTIESSATPIEVNRDAFREAGDAGDSFAPVLGGLGHRYSVVTHYGHREILRATCTGAHALRLMQYLLGTPVDDILVTVTRNDAQTQFAVRKSHGESAKEQSAKSDLVGTPIQPEHLLLDEEYVVSLFLTAFARDGDEEKSFYITEWDVSATESESGRYVYSLVPSKLVYCDSLEIQVQTLEE